MEERFHREIMLYGESGFERLKKSSVIVFGIGGVGGHAAEALCRSGIGKITFVDADKVDITNINRQIIALSDTLGRPKVEVMTHRAKQINPEGDFCPMEIFFDETTAHLFDFSRYDYVVDAIDSIASKLLLIRLAWESNTPVISCMGAGNKTDASAFRVADISQTKICPLARVVRKKCREMGIDRLNVVYSEELPHRAVDSPFPASSSFAPGAMGLIAAGKVINDLAAGTEKTVNGSNPSEKRGKHETIQKNL